MDKPAEYTVEHAKYLDWLRSTGVTNMFGASEYLVYEFGLPAHIAKRILAYWMITFK